MGVPSPQLEAWCTRLLASRAARPLRDPAGLDALTILIPTYGRQEFLLRQMVYWGAGAARVVILDGSPQPLSRSSRDILSTLPAMRYVHLPDTVAARLKAATKYISTPYAVLLGDDEFLLKRGLSATIAKLEKTPSLVACIGQSVAFYPSSDGTSITYGPGYPHWRYETTQDTMRGRLLSAMSRYNAATCYAVYREPFWSKSYGAIQPWSSIYAVELQQAIIAYCCGGVSSVDEVYWLRSFENSSVRSKADSSPKLWFTDWWRLPQFKNERESFVEAVAQSAVSSGGVEYSAAKQAILEAIDAYLARCRPAGRSFGARAIVSGVRSTLADVVKALVPEGQLLGLKAAMKRNNRGPLGSLAQIKGTRIANSFTIDDELATDLSDVEAIILGFWRARLGRA